MTSIIIATRRNFLLRAAGFVSALTPAAALAVATPDLPTITPEIATAIAEWKTAWEAKLEAEKLAPPAQLYVPGSSREITEEAKALHDAWDVENEARMALLRAILGKPPLPEIFVRMGGAS